VNSSDYQALEAGMAVLLVSLVVGLSAGSTKFCEGRSTGTNVIGGQNLA
jgi:hypothetical protein